MGCDPEYHAGWTKSSDSCSCQTYRHWKSESIKWEEVKMMNEFWKVATNGIIRPVVGVAGTVSGVAVSVLEMLNPVSWIAMAVSKAEYCPGMMGATIVDASWGRFQGLVINGIFVNW